MTAPGHGRSETFRPRHIDSRADSGRSDNASHPRAGLPLFASAEHAAGLFRFRAVRDGKSYEWPQVNAWHVRDARLNELWLFPGDFENWNTFWS